MKKLFTMFFTAGLLVLATPSQAAPGHDDGHGHAAPAPAHGAAPHGAPAAHGAAAGGHGAADGAHGEGGHADASHVLYSHDDDGDGTPNWADFSNGGASITETPLFKVGIHAINLALFAGVLFVFGRRPIKDALANRALGIRKELKDSAAVREAAKVRNDELGARLGKIEAELQALRDNAEREALNEETKLIERAHAEAKRIAEASERSIRDEVQRARFALKRDAVALAVDLAESSLKEQLTSDNRQTLAREFLDSLKEDRHV